MPKPKLVDDEPKAVDDGLVTIEFSGHTFVVPRDGDEWSTESTLQRYRASSMQQPFEWMKFVELALGAEQWHTVKKTFTKTGDFNKFIELFTATVSKECDL
jgi:hypothetical protein